MSDMADEQPTEIFDDLYLGLRAGGAMRKQRRGEPLTDGGARGARPLAAALDVAQGRRDRRLRCRHVRPRLHARRPRLRPLAQSLIEVVRGDITTQAVDAIVNAANIVAARRRRRRRGDPPCGRPGDPRRMPAARRLRDRRREGDHGRRAARALRDPHRRPGLARRHERRARAARVVPSPLARGRARARRRIGRVPAISCGDLRLPGRSWRAPSRSRTVREQAHDSTSCASCSSATRLRRVRASGLSGVDGCPAAARPPRRRVAATRRRSARARERAGGRRARTRSSIERRIELGDRHALPLGLRGQRPVLPVFEDEVETGAHEYLCVDP